MLFDRVDVAELLARDAFAKGAYMLGAEDRDCLLYTSWSTLDRANDVCDTLICTYGDSLAGALIYLENFAPDEARERFEEMCIRDRLYCKLLDRY